MDNVLHFIWMSLLQMLYSWNDLFTFSIGAISSAMIGVFLKVSKHNWRWVLLVLIPSILAFAGVEYTHMAYTYIPIINFKEESLGHVHRSLEEADLLYSDSDGFLTLDSEARRHLSAGEDLYSYNFRVVGSNPEPLEFVKKGTTVALTLSWADLLSAISLSTEEMEDFDPQTDYDQSNAIPLNTWSLRFHTTITSLKGLFDSGWFGCSPSPTLESEKRIVRIQLFDFFTGELADEVVCYLGDVAYFSNLFSGTYYYIAFCEGYQPSISSHLYQVYHDDSKPFDEAAWYLPLEKEAEAYSQPFKIQLLDSQGSPLSGVTTRMCTLPMDQLTPLYYTPGYYVTDANGYLCKDMDPTDSLNTDLDDLRSLEFQVCEDYTALISLDGEKYIPVPQTNTSVISMVIDDVSFG